MELESKIISLNDIGLKLLETNTAHSIFYLNQAFLKTRCLQESLNKQKLLAMTYNNLGCYYNAVDQSDKALEFFQKSSRLGRLKGSDVKSIVYSHLNIAGILSKKNQHEKALRHALKSIHYLKTDSELASNNMVTLISAYQVLVLEYLSLDQKKDAKLCCESTLELSYTNLGKNHPKSQEISKFYENNFKTQTLLSKARAGSVVLQRNLTPYHVNKRMLKNRLASYISHVRPSESVSRETQMPRLTYEKKIKPKRFVFKNIDMGYVRALENNAAVKIQAWWRGICCRSRNKDVFILKSIQKAEARARCAIDEIQQLKDLLSQGKIKGSDELLLHINSIDFITSKKTF